MMKRTGVPRLGPDEPTPLPPQSVSQIQPGASNIHTLAQSAQPQILAGATTMLSVGSGGGGPGGFRGGVRASAPAVINYLKAGVQYAPKQPPPPPRLKLSHQQGLPPLSSHGGHPLPHGLPLPSGRSSPLPAPLPAGAPQPPPAAQFQRLKLSHQQGLPPLSSHGGHPLPHGLPLPSGRSSPLPAPLPAGAAQPPPAAQFQRLKVEDALSYLDQVKYKFNTQPQVYNDFLDIMKEFKSQTIDTPGVITRVSNLFKGHSELIVGFNTFLPPGYKIEVQSNGQVSVSMPSPTGLGGVGVGVGVGVGGGVGVGVGSGVLLGVHHAPPQSQLVHLLPVAPSVSNAIVHNLSVSAPPANTLHHISQAHQQIEAAAIHQQQQTAAGNVSTPAGSGGHGAAAPPGQPVEFNHAIEYVNKIKSRFSRQPDKYKRFLEILHAYQRGHRDVKEPSAKQQTEQEVYSQVAKLFENQEDLLAEFGQFLPDAKAVTKPQHFPAHARSPPLMTPPQRSEEAEAASPPRAPLPHHAMPLHHSHTQVPKHTSAVSTAPPQQQHHHLKRSPSFSSTQPISSSAPISGPLPPLGPPAKKPRLSSLSGASVRDVSYAEAAKLATVQDYNFFERARKALRSQHVYENFLRCLLLFTNEIISSSELLQVTAPFLCRAPDLQKWLHDFLGPVSPPHTPTNTTQSYANSAFNVSSVGTGTTGLGMNCERERRQEEKVRYEPIGAYGAQLRHDRPQGDAAMDVDLSTCKRLGTSYCALPREAAARKCSGRTALCKEVLNDTWVSFPTWSEDSTFVTSRKTQYEEYIYRCEDERFELDVVIETNAATIRVLEGVAKRLSRMSSDEAAKQRLDDCLGGHSPTIHQRALRRIYGDKVAVDIIAGLKKNPVVAVPVVLRRLKAKEEEWREAQKGFNKQWREQNEKYYLKSLDHQGINFKQNDLKAMRSKSLFNEVESAYQARRPGPHLVVDYNMQNRQEAIKIVRDTAELLIHHARRQTAIQKAEKRRIKQLLRQFLPDLFSHPRQPLSDDERDEEKEEPASPGSPAIEAAEKDDKGKDVKQEKQESSDTDNASDKSGKNNKNDKENKPKNNNNETKESKEPTAVGVKRSGSDEPVKNEFKVEQDVEDDFRDHPPNEARFVCTTSWYLFLRLHGTICQRLGAARRTAKQLAEQDESSRRDRHPSVATALRLKPNNLPTEVSSPSEYYTALLELVKGVLDGNTEPSTFEDAAREMLGIKAYPAYTLDKLVSIAVRQLQHCVSEPWSVRAAEMAARGGMRGPLSYVRKAAKYLRQDHTAFLVKVYGGDDCKVTFELLEGASEGRTSPHNNENSRLSPTTQSRSTTTNGEAVSRLAAWSLYTERFARPDTSSPLLTTPLQRNKPVFLRRNAKRGGGGAGLNVAAQEASSGGGSVPHARRKPHRLHDTTECAVSNNSLRFVASRPQSLYRPGCLSSARASHDRLHRQRRNKFRAWLRRGEQRNNNT